MIATMSSPMYAKVEAQAARFASRVSGALGERCVGLYLVGSFALGDLQPDSDLDFVAVLAPPVAELRVFDASADLGASSLRNLQVYWVPWIERAGPRLMEHGSLPEQAWAATWCVLGVPRLFVAITSGEIVSKTEAGMRARKTFDPRWRHVIDAALDHRRRNDDASASRVAALRADALAFSSHVVDAAAAQARTYGSPS